MEIQTGTDLRLGDCLEVLKDLPDNSIDLIVTDPPYKFEHPGGGFTAKGNPTNSVAHNEFEYRSFRANLKKLNCCEFEPIEFLNAVKQKMKKFYGYFFCNKSLVSDYIQFAKDNNYQYDILVMAKSNPIPAYNNHHLCDLEYIVMIRDKGTYFSKHKDINDYRKFFLTSCKKGIHPAEKPIELIQRFIKVSSQEGDTVLDCFMGSGTTGVACAQLNRSFIGIEVDPKYFDIAKQRIMESCND